MFLFLIPLILGFVLAGAIAVTVTYSRWWGEGAAGWRHLSLAYGWRDGILSGGSRPPTWFWQ